MIKIFDCEQGSPEWYEARLGVPTASCFAFVMRMKGRAADGSSKQRAEYMRKLAGEIFQREPMENYVSAKMQRGIEWEGEARDYYAFAEAVVPTRVGFVMRGRVGCSPDSLIGEDGGLEIKIADPHIQIERLDKKVVPPEHVAQLQGNLFVTGREWWDYLSYSRRLPPLCVRVYPDPDYLDDLRILLDQFVAELDDMVARLQALLAPGAIAA